MNFFLVASERRVQRRAEVEMRGLMVGEVENGRTGKNGGEKRCHR